MDERPFRDQSMRRDIAQLLESTPHPPPSGSGVSLELFVVQPNPDNDSPHPQLDAPLEVEHLELRSLDARRHLILVLDSHRRRADALAAIHGDDGREGFCVREPPFPIA